MNHNYSIQYNNLLLRPLLEKDIEKLRHWRNDPETTKFLRPIGYITEDMQKNWFKKYLENQNEIVFAVVETQQLNRIVGSVALYNFADEVAEVGKIQIGDNDAHGRGLGTASIILAVYIAFANLGLKRVIASVNRDNIPSYRSFQKAGFMVVGNCPSVVGGTDDIFEIDVNKFKNNFPYEQHN